MIEEDGRGDRVEALLALLERGLVSGRDVEQFLDLMRDAFRLLGVVVGNEAAWESWTRELGVPAEWAERYEVLKDEDPSVAFLRAAPLGTWFVMSRDPNQDSVVFAEARRHGIYDCAIAALPGPFRSVIKLVLFRSVSEGAFSRSDIALARLFYPHFVGAIGSKLALRALQSPPDDRLPEALHGIRAYAHLSFPSRTVKWSDSARGFVQSRLGPLNDSAWARVADALFAAAAQFCGAHLAGRSQPVLNGVRAELAFVPPGPDESRRVLVILVDDAEVDAAPALQPSPHRKRPAEAALSVRQLEVARAAAAGAAIPEIARDLGVSPTTVRTHLRTVYSRLGIHSRAQLARAVGD
ncbi:MAG: helix-turn-helix transcriptional regulator [Myxococcota bacterium]